MATAKGGGYRPGVTRVRQIASLIAPGLTLFGVADRRFPEADCGRLGGGSRIVTWRTIWQCAIAPGVPRRSLAAAVVVGTILNLINQGDALFGGKPVDW